MSLESIPTLMARYALAHPAAMRDEFSERMEMAANHSSEPGKFFVVHVGFDSDDTPETTRLGTWTGLAEDRTNAQAYAIEQHAGALDLPWFGLQDNNGAPIALF